MNPRSEAHIILKKIRNSEDVLGEMVAIEKDVEMQKLQNHWSLFTTKRGFRALIIACMLQLTQQFVGINTLMYYRQGKNRKIIIRFCLSDDMYDFKAFKPKNQQEI